jgi:hypothetical protein
MCTRQYDLAQDKPLDPLRLINSDEKILGVLQESNRYLVENRELTDSVVECLWGWRSLLSLLPQTIEKFLSGHVFPLVEAQYEVESSAELCKLGFYKHAIASLRNVLELGLLSVYWDIDDQSHIDIREWLGSHKPTPFMRPVLTRLRRDGKITRFDERHKIFEETMALYGKLCDYAHTKGTRFSSRRLSKANFNTFHEPSVKMWRDFFFAVTKLVVAFHLLKYPVALQYTPIEQKFGIAGPIGGFLELREAERLKSLFEKNIADTLQEISDNDPGARSLAEWVNAQPDITEEQLNEQFERQDRQMIEMQGYEQWIENEKRLYVDLERTSPAAHAEKLRHFESLRKWAEDNGFMKLRVPTNPPPPSGGLVGREP